MEVKKRNLKRIVRIRIEGNNGMCEKLRRREAW